MIDRFRGKWSFLSSFFLCPVVHEGIQYPSAEHAYQASKTTDEKARTAISKLASPRDAKRLGRRIRLRDDWDAVKLQVMEDIVRAKFNDRRNETLKRVLLSTDGEEIAEGNEWQDLYWGIDAKSGKGENHLGLILMKIRREIKNGEPSQTTRSRSSTSRPR